MTSSDLSLANLYNQDGIAFKESRAQAMGVPPLHRRRHHACMDSVKRIRDNFSESYDLEAGYQYLIIWLSLDHAAKPHHGFSFFYGG